MEDKEFPYVCVRTVTVNKRMEEQNVDQHERSFKWFGVVVATLCIAALIFIIKPFNKSRLALTSSEYSLTSETFQTDSLGFVTDYGGFVVAHSKQKGKFDLCFEVRETNALELKIGQRMSAQSVDFEIDVNGVSKKNSTLFSGKTVVEKVSVRAHDFVYIKFENPRHHPVEVEVKLLKTNGKYQLSIYFTLFIWLACMLFFIFVDQGINTVMGNLIGLCFVSAEWAYSGEVAVNSLIAGLVLAVVITGLNMATGQLNISWLRKIVRFFVHLFCAGLFIFSTAFLFYKWEFGAPLSISDFMAVFQTNNSELFEFVGSSVPILVLIFWGILLLLPFYGWFVKTKKSSHAMHAAAHTPLWLASVFALVMMFSNFHFAQDFLDAKKQYNEELAKFNEVQKDVVGYEKGIDAKKEGQAETIVVVIGESLSKHHMSVYGYHINTTPGLNTFQENGELVVYNRAYSSHTHTVPVLQMALTACNQYNDQSFFTAPTLINVLNAADFETVWISNQVRLSNWDNMVSAIAEGCSKKIYLNKNIGQVTQESPYDAVVLDPVAKILAETTTKNRVIFVHVMGSHARYASRVPHSFKTNDIQSTAANYGGADAMLMRDYDRSVRYNDSIVTVLINLCKAQNNRVSSLIYFSDHGEDLNDNRGHNSSRFTYRMTDIPLVFWFSDEYKVQYPIQSFACNQSRNQVFTNDLIYETVLGMAGIKTEHKNEAFDLTSPKFALPTPTIMSGKQRMDDPQNTSYRMYHMSDSIQIHDSLHRIGIHRVNSLGKLAEVRNLGMQTLELDVVVRDTGMNTWFDVGHSEKGTMSKLRFETWLEKAQLDSTARVWLDFKNLDSGNILSARTHLTSILVKHAGIVNQRNFIVETTSTHLLVRHFVKHGFNVSYYIPTYYKDIVDPKKKKDLAKNLARQLETQGCAYVSFDPALYAWVKSDVQPLVPKQLGFLSWLVVHDVFESQFWLKMEAEAMFKDKRVQVILVAQKSLFEL
ncbi:MAG: heptose-I-phosphate ethanolaminephosphotransferase [Bacteroidia bacterium]